MPGWLTDAEIAYMAATIASATFHDTCDILVQTYTSDGAGGEVLGTAIVSGGSAVPCRRRPVLRRGQVETVGGAEGATYDYIFTFGTAAPIATDRLILHQGQLFQIRQISDNPSWNLCRRADVTIVE